MNDLDAMHFWKKVQIAEGCWLWVGSRMRYGYGHMWIGGRCTRVGGKCTPAHRVSWMIHNGPIPEGLCVLHRCDNPPCVNPAHLFLGTHKDNSDDMIAKGRQGVRPLYVKRTAPLKSHCVQGHEFTPENTQLAGRVHPRRYCRTCQRIWGRASWARRHKAVA